MASKLGNPAGAAAPPTFSVVIPLYNKRDHVRRSLLSVLDQDYPHFEVIVVDDSSTDDSVARIADLAGPRLRIVRQANAGPGPARNRGIAEATTDWIAFLDADDLWYPDHLSELARAIAAHPEAGMAATGFVKRAVDALPPRPQTRDAIRLTDYFTACESFNAVWTSATAVRRDVFAEVGGFKDFRPGQDTEMWARAGCAVPLTISEKVTAVYVLETGGISDAFARRRRTTGAAPRADKSPLHVLLDDRLADPAYAALHGAIRRYNDTRALAAARNALFDGDQPRLRRVLGRVMKRRTPRYLLMRSATLLPARAFDLLHDGWRRARARRRQPAQP